MQNSRISRDLILMIGIVLLTFAVVITAEAAKPPLFELDDIDGNSYKLKDDLGEYIIIIDFWATWCKPCLRELPHINEIYEKHKDQGLKVLAISTDDAASKSRVKPTIRRYKFTFPVLLDPKNEVIRKYMPNRNIPYSALLVRQWYRRKTGWCCDCRKAPPISGL